MKEGKIIKNSHQKIYSRAILPCKNDDIIIETGIYVQIFKRHLNIKHSKTRQLGQ